MLEQSGSPPKEVNRIENKDVDAIAGQIEAIRLDGVEKLKNRLADENDPLDAEIIRRGQNLLELLQEINFLVQKDQIVTNNYGVASSISYAFYGIANAHKPYGFNPENAPSGGYWADRLVQSADFSALNQMQREQLNELLKIARFGEIGTYLCMMTSSDYVIDEQKRCKVNAAYKAKEATPYISLALRLLQPGDDLFEMLSDPQRVNEFRQKMQVPERVLESQPYHTTSFFVTFNQGEKNPQLIYDILRNKLATEILMGPDLDGHEGTARRADAFTTRYSVAEADIKTMSVPLEGKDALRLVGFEGSLKNVRGIIDKAKAQYDINEQRTMLAEVLAIFANLEIGIAPETQFAILSWMHDLADEEGKLQYEYESMFYNRPYVQALHRSQAFFASCLKLEIEEKRVDGRIRPKYIQTVTIDKGALDKLNDYYTRSNAKKAELQQALREGESNLKVLDAVAGNPDLRKVVDRNPRPNAPDTWPLVNYFDIPYDVPRGSAELQPTVPNVLIRTCLPGKINTQPVPPGHIHESCLGVDKGAFIDSHGYSTGDLLAMSELFGKMVEEGINFPVDTLIKLYRLDNNYYDPSLPKNIKDFATLYGTFCSDIVAWISACEEYNENHPQLASTRFTFWLGKAKERLQSAIEKSKNYSPPDQQQQASMDDLTKAFIMFVNEGDDVGIMSAARILWHAYTSADATHTALSVSGSGAFSAFDFVNPVLLDQRMRAAAATGQHGRNIVVADLGPQTREILGVEGADMKLERGETVVVTGAVGTGKTNLAVALGNALDTSRAHQSPSGHTEIPRLPEKGEKESVVVLSFTLKPESGYESSTYGFVVDMMRKYIANLLTERVQSELKGKDLVLVLDESFGTDKRWLVATVRSFIDTIKLITKDVTSSTTCVIVSHQAKEQYLLGKIQGEDHTPTVVAVNPATHKLHVGALAESSAQVVCKYEGVPIEVTQVIEELVTLEKSSVVPTHEDLLDLLGDCIDGYEKTENTYDRSVDLDRAGFKADNKKDGGVFDYFDSSMRALFPELRQYEYAGIIDNLTTVFAEKYKLTHEDLSLDRQTIDNIQNLGNDRYENLKRAYLKIGKQFAVIRQFEAGQIHYDSSMEDIADQDFKEISDALGPLYTSAHGISLEEMKQLAIEIKGIGARKAEFAKEVMCSFIFRATRDNEKNLGKVKEKFPNLNQSSTYDEIRSALLGLSEEAISSLAKSLCEYTQYNLSNALKKPSEWSERDFDATKGYHSDAIKKIKLLPTTEAAYQKLKDIMYITTGAIVAREGGVGFTKPDELPTADPRFISFTGGYELGLYQHISKKGGGLLPYQPVEFAPSEGDRYSRYLLRGDNSSGKTTDLITTAQLMIFQKLWGIGPAEKWSVKPSDISVSVNTAQEYARQHDSASTGTAEIRRLGEVIRLMLESDKPITIFYDEPGNGTGDLQDIVQRVLLGIAEKKGHNLMFTSHEPLVAKEAMEAKDSTTVHVSERRVQNYHEFRSTNPSDFIRDQFDHAKIPEEIINYYLELLKYYFDMQNAISRVVYDIDY